MAKCHFLYFLSQFTQNSDMPSKFCYRHRI